MTKSHPLPLRTLALAACLALAGPLTVHAADANNNSKLARGDLNFMKKAAASGMMEVELGKLAQAKSANDAVRQFGKRMEEDHSKANEKLKSLAAAKGVELPAEAPKREMASLQKKDGVEFDRAYMKHMVADHKKDVSEFEKIARSGKDGDVKAFAAETLPVLQEHRKLAEETHQQVRTSKEGKSLERTTPKQ